MKLLVLSHLFPNRTDRMLGLFVQEQVRALSRQCDIRVISPVPWFPAVRGFKKWGRYRNIPRKDLYEELEITHPRRIVLPRGRLPGLMAPLYFVAVLSDVFRAHRTDDVDLIHAHCVYPDGVAAALVAKIVGKPFIVTSHGADTHRFLSYRTTRGMVVHALRAARRIIAVCQADRHVMIEAGLPAENCVVISNGVDLRTFHPLPEESARRVLDLPLSSRIILYVGNLYPVKGVSYLLSAMQQVVAVRADVLLVIVGDGPLRPALEAQAQLNHLGSRVRFAGYRPHEEVALWMSACTLFCLPSLNEGWPTVLFEAMACGKPCVCTAVGGVPEVLYSSHYGLIVQPGDPQALADGILQGLEAPWDPRPLIEYARQNTWEHKAEALYGVLCSVLGRPSDLEPSNRPDG